MLDPTASSAAELLGAAGQEQLRIELDVAHQAEAAALRMELEGAQRARDAVMQERDDLVAINIQSREIIGGGWLERVLLCLTYGFQLSKPSGTL